MADLGGKRLFLLDMDGTIYLSDRLFPGTKPFLEAVERTGGRCMYLTNNSSRSVDDYVARLRGMGLECARENFVTSVDALVFYLRSRPAYRLCYALGTRSFREQLSSAGVAVTDTLSDQVDCLLAGFDTELTFQKLEDACILLQRGVDFVAANPDWVCPTWYGAVPDCGSLCEMLFRATGRRPRFVGKPRPEMVYLAMERAGVTKEETAVVGDRLYTDVAAGVNAGVDTVFVLSGEGTLADLEGSEVKPTWVLEDVGALGRAISSDNV